MEFIDIHTHVDTRNYEDMVEISKKGFKALISPNISYLPIFDTQSILAATDNLIRTIKPIYDNFFIKVFIGVGLNMLTIPKDYEKVLERLPKYIEDMEEVVAISEVGLDPRDPKKLGMVAETAVATSMEVQTEILKEEMKIAKRFNIPVDCHTPPNIDDPPTRRIEFAERYLELSDEVGLPRDLLIVDHADEELVKFVSDTGANAAITVQPWRNLSPEDAAKIIGKYGTDKILVNSDADSMAPTNQCAVSDTAFAMKGYGMSDEDIRKVTFENPVNLFKLKL